jgi:hypothetical protein
VIDIKVFKVFIASPSDVSELRRVTKNTIELLNRADSRFILQPYLWEDNKAVEHLNNLNDFQQKVFEEFGTWCDIFIILFWSHLGKGTLQEYEFFKSTFKEKNPSIKFWICRYAKPIDPSKVTSSTVKLNKWLKKNQDNWIPIGGTKDAIVDIDKFTGELHLQLTKFLMEQVEKAKNK